MKGSNANVSMLKQVINKSLNLTTVKTSNYATVKRAIFKIRGKSTKIEDPC